MTRYDVIRMARESGMLIPSFRIGGGLALGTCTVPEFERFASLVAAVEREACAQVCDEMSGSDYLPHQCAAAIRARGEPDAP